MKKIRVAVLFGGKSVEHEVSIESARSVCSLINVNTAYSLLLVYIEKNGRWSIRDMDFFAGERKYARPMSYDVTRNAFYSNGKKLDIDVAFSLIHGSTGEDGKLQGLFELAEIAYVGCDVLGSALAMDKKLSKILAAVAGLPILPDFIVTRKSIAADFPAIHSAAARFGYPVFVKPVSLGSSVGVVKVKTPTSLRSALSYALRFDREVMVEKGIDSAREIVCGVLGERESAQTSVCGEVRPRGKHEFYDYRAKYLDDDGMELLIPAPIGAGTSKRIREYASRVFTAIKGYGLSRVDFFLDPRDEKKIYFCEINTIPGFTSHSLYPRLWEKTGVKPLRLIEKLISLALKRQPFKRALRAGK